MATRENLSGYSKQTRKIVRLAQRDLRKFFALLDLTQPAVVRDALLDFLPQLAATYGDIAAVAAAEWYENLRGKVAGLPPYETVLSSGVKREAIVETARWAAGGLWGDDPGQVRCVLEGCVQAWVKYSGRDTVARNVEFDPAKPRYARVPRGSRTCAWCAMLASRGFVYRTKETAGFVEGTFHNDCDCEIVPSFEAKSAHITGYDPDALYAQYKAAQAQVDADGGDINDQHLIVTKMRRLFPESFRDGIRIRKAGGKPKARISQLKSHNSISSWLKESARRATEKDADAFWRWTTGEYRAVQDYLFKGIKSPGVESLVHDLDEALSRTPTTQRITVERAAPYATFKATNMKELYSQIGSTHECKGYISSSLEPGGVWVDGESRFLMRLLLPEGTKAAYIKEHSLIPAEEEVLIIRGGKLKLDRIIDEGDKKVVIVTYIGGD